MSTLQESRRELMVQLEQLMMLLKVEGTMVFGIWAVLLFELFLDILVKETRLQDANELFICMSTFCLLAFLAVCTDNSKLKPACCEGTHSVCHQHCKPSGFILLSENTSPPLCFCRLPVVMEFSTTPGQIMSHDVIYQRHRD